MEPPSAAVICYSTSVEVRGYENQWYMAQLAGIDIGACEVRIAFHKSIWQPRIVPIDAVRFVPKKIGSRPSPGDKVEVFSPENDSTPASWSLGVVSSVKDGLYYVEQIPGEDGGEGDGGASRAEREEKVVGFDCLRAHVQPQDDPEHRQDNLGKCSPSLTNLKHETFEIPRPLGEWMVSDDGRACMRYIAVRVKLSSISVQTSNCDRPIVHLIGLPRPTARACMLLTIHVTHQMSIQSFHNRRLCLAAKRERIPQIGEQQQDDDGDFIDSSQRNGWRKETSLKRPPSISSSVKTTAIEAEGKPRKFVGKFMTTRRLLGLTIGRGGANVRNVEKEFDVKVRVRGVSDETPASSLVIIEGPSEPAVALARKRLEFFITKYPMNPKTVRSVVGPRFSNLLTLAEDTALHYARCSDTNDVGECTPCIEMCGRAEEIDEATKLIESRLLKKEGREGESKQTHIMDMQRHDNRSKGLSGSIGCKEATSAEALADSTADSIDRSPACGTA